MKNRRGDYKGEVEGGVFKEFYVMHRIFSKLFLKRVTFTLCLKTNAVLADCSFVVVLFVAQLRIFNVQSETMALASRLKRAKQ